MDNIFTCAHCGRTFDKEVPDEEALAEARSLFGQSLKKEECDVVCDDCWKLMHPSKHLHLAEQAMAEHHKDRVFADADIDALVRPRTNEKRRF